MVLGESDRRLNVHYHSDCAFFAGCENMLANFFNSSEFRKDFEPSFSYRRTALYDEGLARRVHGPVQMHAFAFPDLSELDALPSAWPRLLKRMFMAALRWLLLLPLLAYEVLALYRLFQRLRPDVLHINSGGYPGGLSTRAAALAGQLARVPVVIMVVNNMAVGYRRFSRWLEYPLDFLIAGAVDVFVTGSQAAGARLGEVMRLSAHKRIAIHNGTAPRLRSESTAETRQRLGLSADVGVVLGVVALLIPRKGHRVLLEALAQLATANQLPPGRLTVLIEGSGPLHEDLKEYVRTQGLTSCVRFVGSEANVVNFMAALDMLVLPSIQDEDFPNVILEAMALAKPVIATRLAGIPEQVVDGETGLLVEPASPSELAAAILKLCLDAAARAKMGQAAAARFSASFTDALSLQHYSSLYKSLFRGKH
jgi:glycosyltransferase involved in cell wall biosynthesis